MIVIDISHWQGDAVDIDTLKLNGVDCVIIKATDWGAYGSPMVDSRFHKYVKACQDSDMPFATYMWDNPSFQVGPQVNHYLKTIEPYLDDIQFVAIDCEQEKDKLCGVRYNSLALASHTISAVATCKQRINKKLLVYSRKSWIDSYCKTLWPMLTGYNLWLAYYSWIGTWSQWLAKKKIKTTWQELVKTYIPRLPKFPTLPNSNKLALWQFTGDTFILPGITTTLDVNFMPGTYSDWLKNLT